MQKENEMTYKCVVCKKTLPNTEFYFYKNRPRSECKKCYVLRYKDTRKRYGKTYYKNVIQFKKTEIYKKYRERYRGIRQTFLEMYGGKCACCGESFQEFLTIEHKNGQTKKTRESSSKAYKNAIKFLDTSTYEILCMNCNHSKGKYGYCPHHK